VAQCFSHASLSQRAPSTSRCSRSDRSAQCAEPIKTTWRREAAIRHGPDRALRPLRWDPVTLNVGVVPVFSGSGDRRVLSMRSGVLSAHYGDDVVSERSATSPDRCIKQRVCPRLSSRQGDGQRNRRLLRFFFRLLNAPSEKARRVWPRVCPNWCAQSEKQAVDTKHSDSCI
jgi:hypothetical protein